MGFFDWYLMPVAIGPNHVVEVRRKTAKKKTGDGYDEDDSVRLVKKPPWSIPIYHHGGIYTSKLYSGTGPSENRYPREANGLLTNDRTVRDGHCCVRFRSSRHTARRSGRWELAETAAATQVESGIYSSSTVEYQKKVVLLAKQKGDGDEWVRTFKNKRRRYHLGPIARSSKSFDAKGRKVTRSEEYEEGEMRRNEERLEEEEGGGEECMAA
ncbi:hypothetical protein V1478_005407 [Vespula squamosa]|uniref:Uncharacterized protein n=1 Tax=Vespula squamosa TaxID=30214 RepID=A0ABD2BE83_VESSQ